MADAGADSEPPPTVSEGSLVFKEHLERLSELMLVLLIGGTLFLDSWSWRAVGLALFLFMVARPLELRVESARLIKPDLAEVETIETWSYEHRTRARPDDPAPVKSVTYAMSYQVQRRPEGWLVTVAVERGPRPGRPTTPRPRPG